MKAGDAAHTTNDVNNGSINIYMRNILIDCMVQTCSGENCAIAESG
jgi:hypothetical protein